MLTIKLVPVEDLTGSERATIIDLCRRAFYEEDYDLDNFSESPFSVAFYMRLGWELWHGPLYVRTETRRERSLRDGDVMVRRLPKSPPFDVHAARSVEWRPGEVW